jgi:hypothetical protein
VAHQYGVRHGYLWALGYRMGARLPVKHPILVRHG